HRLAFGWLVRSKTSTSPFQSVLPWKISSTSTEPTCLESDLCRWKITCFNRSMQFLFATAFNQFFHGPCTAFDACGLRWRHSDCDMPFAKVVISEIQRDSSLKIFELSAECVRQPRESAAVHPQR